MKYVNIDARVFDEPEFTEASPKQVGIWLKLYLQCAKAENGGIILTAGAWTDSHCRRVLGCSRKDLDRSPLWHIKPGGMLNVYHYNLIAEGFAKSCRKTARLAGQSRSPYKVAAAQQNGQLGGRPKGTRKIVPIQQYQRPE